MSSIEELVGRHDLFYEYSEDHGVWRSGEASMRRIREAARSDPERTRAAWARRVEATFPDQKERQAWLDKLGAQQTGNSSLPW